MATKADAEVDGETDRGDAGSGGSGSGPGGDALHPRLRELLQDDGHWEGYASRRDVKAAVCELPLEGHLRALRWLIEDNFRTADVEPSKGGCWALEVIEHHVTNEEVVAAALRCVPHLSCCFQMSSVKGDGVCTGYS